MRRALLALSALAATFVPGLAEAGPRGGYVDDRIVGVPGGVLAPPEYDRAVPVDRVEYPRPYIGRGRLYNLPPTGYAAYGHEPVLRARY